MKFREKYGITVLSRKRRSGAESNGSGANGGETQGNEESNGASGNTFEDFLKDGKNRENLTDGSIKQSKRRLEMQK